MEKKEILEVLEDWNFWTKQQETGVLRPEYAEEIARLAAIGQVVLISGVRRSGKSTLMRQYAKRLIDSGVDAKNVLYVNFEDVRFKELNLDLMQKIFETYAEFVRPTQSSKPFVFLDEVHKIKGWERFARTLHELNKASLFASGSTSRLLSKEFGSTLTGRHLDARVFPLDFKEFLAFKKVFPENKRKFGELELISKKSVVKRLLNEYLEFGGLPLVCLTGDERGKKDLLAACFEDVLSKDVIETRGVKRPVKLKGLAKFFLSNAGRRTSLNALSKFSGLSLNAVESYSRYLEEAFLVFFLKKFSYSVKEQERTIAVVYAADNGLRSVLGFKFSEDAGWALQNAVANLLLKKFGKENLFYWMNAQKEEVDFVVKQGKEVEQLVQVCRSLGDFATRKRELRALAKASEELRCRNLLVVTEDQEGVDEFDGKKIKLVPLWKFLLE
ncbi:MAG: ATP-binding protein [Candidatus Micrarchaeota archaeon]